MNRHEAEQLRKLAELYENANTEEEKDRARMIYHIVSNVQDIKDNTLLKCVQAYAKRLNKSKEQIRRW